MTPNHVLAKTLRGQAKTQRRLSDEAVRKNGAYSDDNDHIDAAILMEQAAARIEQLEQQAALGWQPDQAGEMISCDPATNAARGAPASIGKTYKL